MYARGATRLHPTTQLRIMLNQTPQPADAAGFSPSESGLRERVRFSGFRFVRTPAGMCEAHVELLHEGRRVSASATGQSSSFGDLRVAATAAMRALEEMANREPSFELIGVKLVRAFDANVVIVAVEVREQRGEATRLVGCYLVGDGDVCRGAALSVLNATNRILGNYIATA